MAGMGEDECPWIPVVTPDHPRYDSCKRMGELVSEAHRRDKMRKKKDRLESPWYLVGGIVAGCLAGFTAALMIARKAISKRP